jgi:hypothetical protein
VRVAGRVVELMPIEEFIDLIPIERVVARLPIEQVVARIPIETLVERLPIEQLLARIDMNALLAQLDIDALLARIDIGRIVNDAMSGIDFEELIHASTVGVGSEARDVGRTQAMNVDFFVARVVDRILRRDGRKLDVGPRGLTPIAP